MYLGSRDRLMNGWRKKWKNLGDVCVRAKVCIYVCIMFIMCVYIHSSIRSAHTVCNLSRNDHVGRPLANQLTFVLCAWPLSLFNLISCRHPESSAYYGPCWRVRCQFMTSVYMTRVILCHFLNISNCTIITMMWAVKRTVGPIEPLFIYLGYWVLCSANSP